MHWLEQAFTSSGKTSVATRSEIQAWIVDSGLMGLPQTLHFFEKVFDAGAPG